MTFIKGPEIVVIMFTQSTAVLHEYLNDELKLLSCYNFFPRSEFPEFSVFREISEHYRFSRFVATLVCADRGTG